MLNNDQRNELQGATCGNRQNMGKNCAERVFLGSLCPLLQVLGVNITVKKVETSPIDSVMLI